MELPYQTLKNTCERILKGRKEISRPAVEALEKAMIERAEEIIEEAVVLADMTGKKRISSTHLEQAVVLLFKRR